MNIQFSFNIAGAPTDTMSVVFRDPSNTFGVRRVDTLETVVAAGTALAHTGVGEYEYTFVDPDVGIQYNYWIEWVYAGNTYRYEQTISAGGETVAYVNVPEALPRSCISLARYAYLTGYSECAIMGVNNPSETYGDCENPIWTQTQRDMLLYYLSLAQEKIEEVTRYPLCRTYITNEEHPYRFPIRARWNKIIQAGVRAVADIALAASIDYSVEPALIGPIATSLTDTSQVKIFYPNSDREIEPNRVTISSGLLRIYISRCRLLHPDMFSGVEGGIAYEDLDNFLETVDVKQEYTDTSVNAELVWAHRDSIDSCENCGCLSCDEHTETGCLYIRNAETGALDVLRGSFTNDIWTPTCNYCFTSGANKVRVNYLAGLNPITKTAENAVLRLAHTLMPQELCGCDVLKTMWLRDNKIPDFVSNEREKNPFGPSDGAWQAYRFAYAISTKRMTTW